MTSEGPASKKQPEIIKVKPIYRWAVRVEKAFRERPIWDVGKGNLGDPRRTDVV